MNSLYDESPFLEHHGIKGQKWGVRRFQNYDGTRIKGSDIVLKKGEKVYRYSNKKEKGSTYGTYAFRTLSDTNEYYVDSKNVRLGFQNYKKIFMTEISVLDDARIRRGRDTVKDIVDKIADTKVSDAFKTLDEIGFLDDSKTAYERSIIWEKTKESKQARKTLGSALNKYLYKKETSGDTREKQLQEYVKNGYDAIVDPEDFIWNYEMPMILLNNDKFKRVRSEAIYNNDFDTYSKWADEQLAKGVPRRDVEFTPEETKALNDFINGVNRKVKKGAKK